MQPRCSASWMRISAFLRRSSRRWGAVVSTLSQARCAGQFEHHRKTLRLGDFDFDLFLGRLCRVASVQHCDCCLISAGQSWVGVSTGTAQASSNWVPVLQCLALMALTQCRAVNILLPLWRVLVERLHVSQSEGPGRRAHQRPGRPRLMWLLSKLTASVCLCAYQFEMYGSSRLVNYSPS